DRPRAGGAFVQGQDVRHGCLRGVPGCRGPRYPRTGSETTIRARAACDPPRRRLCCLHPTPGRGPPMRRREFLQGAAVTTLTALSAGRVRGANERVTVGLIGCGGRGRYVARLMAQVPGAAFVAACDVYEPNAGAARDWAGSGCQAYRDFRQVLDRK